MELSGPAPLGAQAALAAQLPTRRAPDVQRIDPGRQTDGTGADSRQRPEQDQTAASARDIARLRDEARRRDLPAGPTPAFQVSLLEMEGDLAQVIARIEAARTQARDAEAIKAPAEAEAARIEARITEAMAQAEATPDIRPAAPGGADVPETRPSDPEPARSEAPQSPA